MPTKQKRSWDSPEGQAIQMLRDMHAYKPDTLPQGLTMFKLHDIGGDRIAACLAEMAATNPWAAGLIEKHDMLGEIQELSAPYQQQLF
jgi:hypothetical protein